MIQSKLSPTQQQILIEMLKNNYKIRLESSNNSKNEQEWIDSFQIFIVNNNEKIQKINTKIFNFLADNNYLQKCYSFTSDLIEAYEEGKTISVTNFEVSTDGKETLLFQIFKTSINYNRRIVKKQYVNKKEMKQFVKCTEQIEKVMINE